MNADIFDSLANDSYENVRAILAYRMKNVEQLKGEMYIL